MTLYTIDHKTKKKPAANSTYPKGGVSCSKVSLVVNQTLVFQIKFCGKSPALRVAANRLSLHVQSTLSYAPFSDYLDDVGGDFRSDYDNSLQSYAANPANYNNGQGARGTTHQGFFKNDAFLFTSISLQWSFSPKKNAFRAPRLYASSRPKSVYEINPDSLQRKTMDNSTFGRTNTTTTAITQTTTQQTTNPSTQQNTTTNQSADNTTQRVAIDINVNVNTTRQGTDSSITKVMVSPTAETATYSTANAGTASLVIVDTTTQNRRILDLENRLKVLESSQYRQETPAQQQHELRQSQEEVERLQLQIEALNNTTTPNDSALYRLMDMQFQYLQERLKLLNDKIDSNTVNQSTPSNNAQQTATQKEISALNQKIEELTTQLQVLKNASEQTKPVALKDTLVIKEEKAPTKNEVVGVRKVEIFFKTGSADIHPKDKAKLTPMIEVLKQNPTWSARIHGFTDSRGSATFNQKLSQRRTAAVKALFLDAGVLENQLIEGSFGIDVNNPYGEDFYGRRVEVELIAK